MARIPSDLRKKNVRSIVLIYKERDGNKLELARALSVSRQTLHAWIRDDPDLARALHKADAELFEARLKKARVG